MVVNEGDLKRNLQLFFVEGLMPRGNIYGLRGGFMNGEFMLKVKILAITFVPQKCSPFFLTFIKSFAMLNPKKTNEWNNIMAKNARFNNYMFVYFLPKFSYKFLI